MGCSSFVITVSSMGQKFYCDLKKANKMLGCVKEGLEVNPENMLMLV